MIGFLKKRFQEQEELLQEARMRLPAHESGIKGIRKARHALTENHVVLEDRYDLAAAERLIWHVVEKELRSMKPDETLVILAGECHVMPMTMLVQAGLLERLAGWRDMAPQDPARRIAFAYEQPYDILYDIARNAYGKNLPKEARKILHDYDRDGHIAMKAIIGHDDIPYAAYATEQVVKVALRRNISFCFNDACALNEFKLSPDDELTARIARDEFGIDMTKKRVSRVTHPDALDIRNGVMAARAIEYARKNGIRVMVQRTGMAHVYGNQPGRSLTERFNEAAGFKTIGISFSMREKGISAVNSFTRRIISKNRTDIIFENAASDFFYRRDKEAEKEFVRKLYKSYGPGSCAFESEDPLISEREAAAMVADAIRKTGIKEDPPKPRSWWQKIMPGF